MDAAGIYPPVFYSVLSVFVNSDVAFSVAVIRMANALLATALLTVVFWVLPRFARTPFVVSLAVTIVPLGLFILPSTNPSSWALLSAAIVWVTMWAAYLVRGRRQWALAALAVIGGVVGAGARADAAAFAVFAVLLAAVLGLRKLRASVLPLAASATVIAVSAVSYLGSGQSSAVISGLSNDRPPLTLAQHAQNLLDLPELWIGAVGASGLGWLDTSMPSLVWVITTVALGSAVVLSIRGMSGRRLCATLLAFAAIWIVPFVLLAQSNTTVGSQVQPRYILPLLIILAGVAAASVHAPHWWRGGRAYVTAAALAVAAAVALHTNVRRYTTGVDSWSVDPGAGAEWWWAAVLSPVVIWVVGSLSFAILLGIVAYIVTAESRTLAEEKIASFASDSDGADAPDTVSTFALSRRNAPDGI